MEKKLKIEGTASLGSKGQIVIPKTVRNKFKLIPGDDLIVLSSQFGIMLIKSEDLKNMMQKFENMIDIEKNI